MSSPVLTTGSDYLGKVMRDLDVGSSPAMVVLFATYQP